MFLPTLFVMTTFLGAILFVCFLQLKQSVFSTIFSKVGNIFYGLGTTCLKALFRNLLTVLVFFSNPNDNSANPSRISFMTDF